ncbi:MAG TPA: hypothetical protein VMV69_19235 [Pirellulales bacterium]|nr:hypothetical protein [Pirellulales bacterium]
MTAAVYAQLVDALKGGAQRLTRLHALAAEEGSVWSVEQLHLFFAVLDGMEVEQGSDGTILVRLGRRTAEEELALAVIELVRSQGGKPVPATLVVRMLADRFTTSAEQVKKVAREAAGLNVVGPGLIALES